MEQSGARKARLAAQSELIATRAAEHLLDALHTRKIKGAALVPVYGCALDKMMALRGDPSLTIRHEHLLHTITKDTLLAYAVAQSKTVRAKVIDTPVSAPALGSGPTIHQNGEGKQSKKKVL